MKKNNLVVLLGLIVAAVALCVIAGWFLHMPVLIKIYPTLNSMKFNTALGFLLSGFGLISYFSRHKIVSPFLGFIVALWGMLNLWQYMAGVDLKIDQLFYHDYLTDPAQFPGRMAPQTAVCFFIYGASLFIGRIIPNMQGTLFCRSLFGAFLFIIGITAIFGFIFHVPFAFTWGSYNAMALHTAICFILLGAGIVITGLGSSYNQIIITCLVGCTLAFQVYNGILNTQDTMMSAHFIADSKDRSKEIQAEFLTNHHTIAALDAFYESSEFVSREEFAKFTQAVLKNENHGHIDALEWIPQIKKEEISAILDQAKSEGLKNFQFKELTPDNEKVPIQERAEYYPVLYKEPQKVDDEILGVDFSTSPERWQAMQSACQSTMITSTKPLNLLRGQTDEEIPRGYLIFSPVYHSDKAIAEAASKCEDIKGFVVGIFRIKSVIEEALKSLNEMAMDVYLYDLSVIKGEQLFYYHKSPIRSQEDTKILTLEEISHLKTIHYTEEFSTAGQDFLIVTIPTSQYSKQYKTFIPVVLLILILLFTLILTMYVFSRMKRTVIIEKLVDERTNALRESEERYRSLFNSIDEGFCIIQMIFDQDEKPIDFRYLQVNPSFKKQSGIEGEVEGKRIRELVPQLESNWFEIFGQTALTGEPARFENRSEYLQRWYDVYAFRFGAPEKRQVALLFNDISARKEAAVKIMNAMNAKSDFTSMVSHELRTPLTVIKESVAIVYDETAGPINPDQKDFLETAKRNVDRLGRLINDVLDYQKLEGQHMEFRMKEQSINEVVKEVGAGFKRVLENKGVELQLKLQPDLPNINFDKDKITQVLTNLLNNAVKFTDKGTVFLTTEMSGENAIKVSVKDQGVGIKPEDLDKLFKSFSQISSGVGRQTGGTGLGLALSKQIVEQHKGKVGVESVFGEGSTFYFFLPIQERRHNR